MEALSGVDIALWDLIARSRNEPMATTLGAEPGPVSVYVSPIPFRNTPQETASELREFVRQGYTAFKLKVGRGVKIDLDHIEAARDAAGDAPLYLDANCAYDVGTAIELAKHLDRFDIGWLEEPINPDNPEALRAVRQASPVPIGAGENEFTQEAYEYLSHAWFSLSSQAAFSVPPGDLGSQPRLANNSPSRNIALICRASFFRAL